MSFLTFELEELSIKRTQLMGIATLMIIICHASASHVLMPHWLSSLMDLGNFGVDIFLFLSGLGLFYSLSKKPVITPRGGVNYYKRRYYRICIPYLLVFVPYSILYLILHEYTLLDSLLCISALEFWFFHRGAWFVSLIVILYLLAPDLVKVLSKKGKWIYLGVFILVITVLCKMPNDGWSHTNLIHNVQFAFGRVPSFLMGMTVAQACMEKKTVSVVWLLILAIAGLVLAKVFTLGFVTAWLVIPLVMWLFVLLINMSNSTWSERVLLFFGGISLESYLTNISVNSALSAIIPEYLYSTVFYGKYLQYAIVVVAGLVLAYYVKKCTSRIIKSLP